MAQKSIQDLPDEILEFIMCLVSPYQELQHCKLVCKRWQAVAQTVAYRLQHEFERALVDGNLRCTYLSAANFGPTVAERYSHSASYHEKGVMYVFGGCTSTSTTFNDLWQLDLDTRLWVRPLAVGTYPSPKACASLARYQDDLLLFGGWTHPSPYPLHQPWRLFNEFHIYRITSNRWDAITTQDTPPPTAGHSATVHGNLMVVFGGLQKIGVHGQFESSNSIWCFDCSCVNWHLQETTNPKPQPRYGQSQICLDDKHLLVMGGCGRPNKVFSDIWLLELCDPVWKWTQMKVLNPNWAASRLWCHPACKVGDKVVVLSMSPLPVLGSREVPSFLRQRSNVWVPPLAPSRPLASGALPCTSSSAPSLPTSIHNTALPSIRPNAMSNRKRQLDSLQRMEDRIRALAPQARLQSRGDLQGASSMVLHVLDVGGALKQGQVSWMPRRRCPGSFVGHEESILYTLVCGRAELVVFGGVQRDPGLQEQAQALHNVPDTVSNTLYFIKATKAVV